MRTGRGGGGNISNDQVNHERYRNEIFLPFVEGSRKTYLGNDDWSPEDVVKRCAMGQCDGKEVDQCTCMLPLLTN